MRTVYIIPGYTHSPQIKIYKDVGKIFQENGFKVVYVKIDWKYKTISDWVDQFLNEYYKSDGSKKYLFGFSFGAVISILSSTKVKIDSQILCSLSPYFDIDLTKIYKSWKKQIGKNRIEDFEKLNMEKVARFVKAKTYLLYGTREGRFIKERAEDTYKKLNCYKKLILVNGAKHDIGNKEYLEAIKKVIEDLDNI